VDRVSELVEEIGPAGQELVAAVMDMYEGGLVRAMSILEGAGESAAGVRAELIADPEFASVLLVHGLYPVSLEDRVMEALESVRPYMESHGGDVEFVSIDADDVVHLRLAGHCKTCSASSATLETAIKAALDNFAPELAGMEVTGFEEATHAAPEGIPLPVIQSPGIPLPMAAS
jgi:Fe-S cluster biogenesis protein NfuA